MEVAFFFVLFSVVSFKAGEKYGEVNAKSHIINQIEDLQEKVREIEKQEIIKMNDTSSKYKDPTTGFYTSKRIREEEE